MNIYKIIVIIAVIFYIICRKLRKVYSYWERKGVNGPKPVWLVGNVLSVLRKKESIQCLARKISEMYPNEQLVGIYMGLTPTLILRNVNLIKDVLIKDFACFSDRGIKFSEELLAENMFLEKDEKWRFYRQKVSPLFSTSRMKKLLPIVAEHIDEFLNYVENLPRGPKELRMLDHKLSIKLMMFSLFGIKVDTYNEECKDLQDIGYDMLQISTREMLGAMLHGLDAGLPSALGLKSASAKLEKFFRMIINKCEKAKVDKQQQDETIFDFLLKLKEKSITDKEKGNGNVDLKISYSALASHVLIFYGSGFESFVDSSFMLFELALNQAIQERCYGEIVEVMKKYNGELTFEAINELHYLNMTFQETLRKYPSGSGLLIRVATKDYVFEEINLTIEKGTRVIIPVAAIHNNPEYFPKPKVFDPERFLPENKKLMPDCSYLAFGDGPRKCVGYRLGTFKAMVMLARFLQRFKVTPCEKTVPEIRLAPYRFSLFTLDGLWVNITKRE